MVTDIPCCQHIISYIWLSEMQPSQLTHVFRNIVQGYWLQEHIHYMSPQSSTNLPFSNIYGTLSALSADPRQSEYFPRSEAICARLAFNFDNEEKKT